MTLAFTFTGGEGHDLEIQWYHDDEALVNGVHGSTTIAGATTTTLVITDPDATYDGEYYVVVNDLTAECTVTSNTLDVTIPGLCRLEITEQPESQELTEGEELELTVAAIGNAGTLTYQWYLDGNPLADGTTGSATIAGATTATLTITAITPALAGDYTVVVNDEGIVDCSLTSEAAAVTVEAAATNTISLAFFLQMLTQPDPAGADILSGYDFELWDDPSGTRQSRIRLSMAAVGGGADTYTFTLEVSQGGDSNTFTSSPIALPLRTWHHVAIVYNGTTGFASLYVDTTLAGTTSGTVVTLTAQPYGYINFTGASHSPIDYLDSYVYMQDLTGLWVGHGLTGSELTALYNAGAGYNGPPWGSITEPTAWWDFDDAGRVDGTENFVDAVQGVELDPQGSVVQFEGLIDFGILKNGFNRTLETDITAAFAYTA